MESAGKQPNTTNGAPLSEQIVWLGLLLIGFEALNHEIIRHGNSITWYHDIDAAC